MTRLADRIDRAERTVGKNGDALSHADIDAAVERFANDRIDGDIAPDAFRALLGGTRGWLAKALTTALPADLLL